LKHVLLAALSCGCSSEVAPRTQWLVVLATDANVPSFADRLLIDVGECIGSSSTCQSRELQLSDPDAWPISFGIAPQQSQAEVTFLRVRLFRSDRTIGGVPEPSLAIDASVFVPVIDEPTTVSLVLDMRCAGIASDPLDKLSCDPDTRLLVPSPVLAPTDDLSQLPEPGSWASIPCSVEAPSQMVCLPGSGFVLGDRDVMPELSSSEYAAAPERLVSLSPFYLDIDELTVGQMRELVNGGLVPWEPEQASDDFFRQACTYLGAQDPGADHLPVNCVGQDLAAAACAAVGKRLPTEAELEYAAGNGVAETPYPWGHDRNVCAYAAVELGGPCRLDPAADPAGPIAGGSELDVTEVGIRNLAGNLSEWTADASAAYTDLCWSQLPVPAHDPVCNMGGAQFPGEHIVRGGHWDLVPASARNATRYTWLSGAVDYPADWLGFRCAQSHP